MTPAQFEELHTTLVRDLAPFLVCEPPSLDFSSGKYICLKVHGRHFYGGKAPTQFSDIMEPNIGHIHIEHDRDGDAHDGLQELAVFAGPELRQVLQPILFTLRLEGAL